MAQGLRRRLTFSELGFRFRNRRQCEQGHHSFWKTWKSEEILKWSGKCRGNAKRRGKLREFFSDWKTCGLGKFVIAQLVIVHFGVRA